MRRVVTRSRGERAEARAGAKGAKAGARAGARAGGRRAPVMLAVVLLLAGAAWLLVGCGPKVGVTQELLVDEPLASGAVTEVRLIMGEGRLAISPGAAGLVAGSISYNVADWKPEISRSDDRVIIQQGSTKGVSGTDATVVNEWNLELGLAPMRLKIEAGVYQGVFDLSGLSLQEVDIKDGVAQTEVIFSLPNPSQMERLRYTTGASAVSFVGLANANLASMEFTGAAGTYALDFSGQLRSDATVEIKVSGGTVRIEVPSTTRAQVRITGTTAEVDTHGSWIIDGSNISTQAFQDGEEGKTLIIELEMTAGSVTLVTE